MENIINEIKTQKIGKVIENILMKDYTTYKVGGKVRVMVYPRNEEKLIELMKIIKKYNLKYKVIGNGSNVIFSDKDYDGIIIKLDNFDYFDIIDTVVTVGQVII